VAPDAFPFVSASQDGWYTLPEGDPSITKYPALIQGQGFENVGFDLQQFVEQLIGAIKAHIQFIVVMALLNKVGGADPKKA